jgi:hypothetical protein
MKQYRLKHVVLGAGRCGFKEGFLWHQPNGTWGVELGGVAGLRDLIPNRSVSLGAQSEDGTRFMGQVMVLSLGELNLSSGRLHLSGVDRLRTGAT